MTEMSEARRSGLTVDDFRRRNYPPLEPLEVALGVDGDGCGSLWGDIQTFWASGTPPTEELRNRALDSGGFTKSMARPITPGTPGIVSPRVRLLGRAREMLRFIREVQGMAAHAGEFVVVCIVVGFFVPRFGLISLFCPSRTRRHSP